MLQERHAAGPFCLSGGYVLTQDIKKIRKRLFNTFLKEGLNTKEELDFWIQEFLGFDVPKKKTCPNHVSPFKFLYDCFMEKVGDCFVHGSRGSGKTRIFSLLNQLNLTFKPGISIVSAGATLDQSSRCYSYTQGYYKDPLLQPLLIDSIKSYSEGANGATLKVITGSMKGFNGPHPVKSLVDEIELIKWEILQECFSMSLSANGYKAQTIMASTRKWAGGTVSRILEEAPQRGLSLYNFCVLDVLETCHRQCLNDPVYGDCVAYQAMKADGEYLPLCFGAAHNARGWMSISDFLSKVQTLDFDTLNGQWFNRGTSDASHVYGEFWNPQVHVLTWEQFRYLTGHSHPPVSWARHAGLDFGANFAFVKAAESPDGVFFIYNEYFHNANVEGSRLLKRHAEEIHNSPDFGLEVIYHDPSGLQESLELQSLGVPCTPADNDVLLGINDVKQLLQRDPRTGRPKLYVLDNCEETIHEFESYCHPQGDDGFVDRDTIIKQNDHCLVAGTLVLSERGWIPIEIIEVGELVCTRQGYKPVVAAGMTQKDAELWIAQLSNGLSLTGTFGHPIYVKDKEFVPLGLLQLGDMLESLDRDVNVKDIAAGGRAPVFNITVAEAPEFYANGVLVHNCLDALRYLVRSSRTKLAHYTTKRAVNLW